MQDLNPRQLRFVQLYVRYGNASKAALEAGYSEATARQQGSRLLSKDHIQKAVQAALADIDAVLADQIVDSIRVMAQLRDDGEVPPDIRLKACDALLNRAMGKPTERVEHKGDMQVTWPQLMHEARDYLRVVKGAYDGR